MRISSIVLLVALLSAGCAARLPTATTGAGESPHAASAPPLRAVSTWTTVSEERLTRVVVPHGEFEAASEGIREAAEEEEEFWNEITVFAGYTFERGEGGATVGLCYARMLTRGVGVGPFVDYVAGELDALAIGAGFYFRPFEGARDLTVFVGPGVDLVNEEREAEEHEGEHGGSGGKTWEAEFMIRLGVMYGFDLGRGFRFVPAFYWDIISMERQAYVLGFEFGKEF